MARLEPYERADGRWDWRVIADNGGIVGGSEGQGFRDEVDTLRGFLDFMHAALRVVEIDALTFRKPDRKPDDAAP